MAKVKNHIFSITAFKSSHASKHAVVPFIPEDLFMNTRTEEVFKV